MILVRTEGMRQRKGFPVSGMGFDWPRLERWILAMGEFFDKSIY